MSRILVAEDNPVNRALIREILDVAGYEVIEVCDGEEAVQKIEETPLDLVLLDIQLPGPDGFALLRHLRSHPRFARLPVVAVTAYAMRGDREKALGAGFDGYLAKPIDAAALRQEVEKFLNPGTKVRES